MDQPEKMTEAPPLFNDRIPQKRGDIKTKRGVFPSMAFAGGDEAPPPIFLLVPEDLGRLGHPGKKTRAPTLPSAKGRTNAISQEQGFVVGGVLPPGDFPFLEVGKDFVPGDPEQGASQPGPGPRGPGSVGGHARQSGRAGAAEQVQHDGFGLIAERVGREDPRAPKLPGGPGQRGVAEMARGLFHAFSAPSRPLPNMDPLHVHGQSPGKAPPFHKGGVGPSRSPPQPVVYVADGDKNPGFATVTIRQVRQGHGIRAAGTGDEEAGRRRGREATAEFGEEIGQRGYLLVIT
jgi:hypothetical protein